MKPVMQTRFGVDPNAPGNCFSACVASVLECALEDLPDEAAIVAEVKREFPQWETWPNRYKWGKSWERLWNQTQLECARRGLWMLEVKGNPFGVDGIPPVWSIISAKSPRGDFDHSCVGFGKKIVHDPHPDNANVAEVDRTFIFFVALNPAVDHCCPECPIDEV